MFTANNYKDFTYWFLRIGTSDTWSVRKVDSNMQVATLVEADGSAERVQNVSDAISSEDVSDIITDFSKFVATRPEYCVGKRIDPDLLSCTSIDADIANRLVDAYDKLISGVIYIQAEDDAQATAQVSRCINWLHGTDFYSAPASTKYHDSNPYGLLQHTLRVVDNMVELLQLRAFESSSVSEATVTALTHDWCKIGLYEEYYRNVKDDTTNTWHRERAYRCNESKIPFGHGTASMYIASKFFKLSIEQAAAIRWHMGASSAVQSEVYDYWNSNDIFPLSNLLQFADRLSTMKA